jgi:hypothetical protein
MAVQVEVKIMENTESKPTGYINKKILLIFLFFALFFSIGLTIYNDYGISWDEEEQRKLGTLTYEYAFEGKTEFLDFKDRIYGVAIELPLIIIEKAFHLEDSRDIYLMRHFVNFLLFFISTIFFYFLCNRHFRSYKWGLLATAFLILSPRIFADSFYNSKDLPFLSIYIIAIYTLVRLLDKISVSRAVVHGIACAVLTNTRILGIMLFFLTIIFLVWDNYKVEPVKTTGRKKAGIAFSISFLAFLYLSWPYLWQSPLLNFINAFISFSHFRYHGTTLFYGHPLDPENLPWYYIPGWMLVTVPVLYTLTFFAGIIRVFNSTVNTYPDLLMSDPEKRNNLIFLSWLFLPVIAVIILNSTLYDSWRQVFFIYPPFIIFSITGVRLIYHYLRAKKEKPVWHYIFIGIVSLSLVQTAYRMVKEHPYQNVYFNFIAYIGADNLEKRFALDYWSLSFRGALEYILANDNDKLIYLSSNEGPAYFNQFILPKEQRDRIKMVNPGDAEYFLTYKTNRQNDGIREDEFYTVKVDNNPVATVFKVNQEKVKALEARRQQVKSKGNESFFDFMEKRNPALAAELRGLQNLPKEVRKLRFEQIKKKYPGFFR